MKKFNPLDYPIGLMDPTRNIRSPWTEYVPFGMTLIDLLRPSIFVELGANQGVSYGAFCQAIAHLRLDTRAYAVDTWRGDPQNGANGPAVLEDLKAFHDPLYGSFSRLVQSAFDDALQHFPDGSIDLLHINGAHLGEAVAHDFSTWLPRMSRRGVVILHGINVRESNSGVRKLWHEIKERYPSFDQFHQYGLGLVVVGPEIPEALRLLIDSTGEERVAIRAYYFHLGRGITAYGDKASFENCLAESQSRHEAQLTARRATHEAQLVEQRGRHEAELGVYQERIARMRVAHADELAREQANVAALRSELAETQQLVQLGQAQLDVRNTLLEVLQPEMLALRNQLLDKEAQVGSLAAAYRELEGRYQQLQDETTRANASEQSLQAALGQTHASLAWRLAHFLSRCSRKLAPAGTRRRRVLGTARRAARALRRSRVKRVLDQATAKLLPLGW